MWVRFGGWLSRILQMATKKVPNCIIMSSLVHHSLAPENHSILYLWSTSHFIHQFSLRRPYKRSSLHQESTSSHISRFQGQPQVVPWRLVLPWQLGAMTHARWWATLTPSVALCLIEIDMASSIATSNLVQERSPPRRGLWVLWDIGSMGHMGDGEKDDTEYEIRMILSEVELWW